MENTNNYIPEKESSINPVLLSNNCGWGFGCGSPFGGGVLGFLLGALLSPLGSSVSTYPSLPDVPEDTWTKFEEETKDMSFEERKAVMKKYFDPEGVIDKYFEKLKNPKEAAKLQAKLIKQDAKIAVISKKKQEIVDKWVNS